AVVPAAAGGRSLDGRTVDGGTGRGLNRETKKKATYGSLFSWRFSCLPSCCRGIGIFAIMPRR
ncbi:MAG: hypothetical protein ACK4E7_13455, partial [Permianibacter sp.]